MKNIFCIEKDYDPSNYDYDEDPKTKKPMEGIDSWDEEIDTDWEEEESPEGD